MDLIPGVSKVIHKTFGVGVFVEIRKSQGNEYVHVKFESKGEKDFVYPTAFTSGLLKEFSEDGAHKAIGKQTRHYYRTLLREHRHQYCTYKRTECFRR